METTDQLIPDSDLQSAHETSENAQFFDLNELIEIADAKITEIDDIALGDIDTEEELVEQFKQTLLEQSDRFSRVYETGSGSIYFVANDGSSLRIKDDGAGIGNIQPVLKKQLLVDKPTADNILEIREDGSGLIGIPIAKADYQLGAYPFEFGIIGLADIAYEEDEKSLTIIGDAHGHNSSGNHLGHPITRIIR